MNNELKKEIENFINYLNSKVEKCYKSETDRAVKEFLKDLGR